MKRKEIKEIREIPKVYQEIYKAFTKKLALGDAQAARELLRPILDFYTLNDWEVPQEIEIHYARLYLLELKKEKP
jgi:hypothetical protein